MSTAIAFVRSQYASLPPIRAGSLLEGKIAVLTGANSGIGYETAFHLASNSPRSLILAVRTIKTGEDAKRAILAKFPDAKIQVWELDLGKFASVKAFAARAATELDVVDVLVNNAGFSPGPGPMTRTEDGHEQTVQVNVYSPLLLGLLLQPLLDRSTSPRHVITSSEVHSWAEHALVVKGLRDGSILKSLDDEGQYLHAERYMLSKLLLQMIVRKLVPFESKHTVIAVNPGWCFSGLNKNMSYIKRVVARGVMTLVARTSEVGARNVTSAVLATTGSTEYWTDCAPAASPSVFLKTPEAAQAVELYWGEVMAELKPMIPQ